MVEKTVLMAGWAIHSDNEGGTMHTLVNRNGLKRLLVLMVVVGLAVAAAGCSAGSGSTDDIQKRLSDLEATVKSQQETIDGLSSDDTNFSSRIKSLESLHSDSAYLSSDSLDSYVVVRAAGGDLLVMLEDCVKYMDGYKLELKIGNPSSATYSGFTISGTWPQFAGRFSILLPSTKTKTRTQTYAGNLPGGSWTHIEFVATPATADDMKGVKLTFDTNTVSLKGGS